ncbi:MAG: hypothetical protein ABI358_11785 [Ginsengibacter sp.]
MPQKKVKQIQFESNTWKRLLDFFREENVYFKNRLSDILKESFDRNLLDALENFQNRFIIQDELNGALRNEISELDKLLLDEKIKEVISKPLIERILGNLRENLSNSEKRFCALQLDFNKYLYENIS